MTIHGLGGIGKTALAREIAGRRTAAGEHVVVVDLAPLDRPAAVLPAIARALGAGEDRDRDLRQAIIDQFDERPTLLVVDNFEHVLPAVADLEALLTDSPRLRILATSRVPLGVDAEVTDGLGALALPAHARVIESAPASALFLRRARERGRLAAIDGDESVALVAVCRRLDGIPLALELAAAWTGILTPRAILRRLDEEQLDLTGDDPRHSSLAAVVTSTLDLVTEQDRNAFDVLGVFASAFDQAAAEAVSGDAGILARLRDLEGVALVRVGSDGLGEPRFELLETIRTVAAGRLRTAGGYEAACRRHAALYANRAVQAADAVRVRSFGDPIAGERLGDANIALAADRAIELGDGELAVRLSAALATRAMQTGILRPTLARLRRAMAVPGASDGVRADGLNALVSLRDVLGEPGDQLSDAREAVALARAVGEPVRVVRTLVTLGNMSPDEAPVRYEEAARLAESIGYAWGATTAWGSLADHVWKSGRREEAVEAEARAKRASEREGDLSGAGAYLARQGEFELNLGRVAVGRAHLEEAATLLRTHRGLPFFVTAAEAMLAVGQSLDGSPDEAHRTLASIASEVDWAETFHGPGDWLEAASIVLESRHPLVAARCLGALDGLTEEAGEDRPSRTLLDAAAGRIERSVGRIRLQRERAAGRLAGASNVVAETIRLVRREAGAAAGAVAAPFGDLTTREQEILGKLARGQTDREIASELGISPKTASVHVANLKAKLGVTTRVEAVLFAREHLGGEGRRAGD